MQSALPNFQSILKKASLEGFIVTKPYNILYLSGFRGISETEREAILVVTQNQATLITARLYQQEANKVESKDLKVLIASERDEIDRFIKSSLKNARLIGFEETDLKYGEFVKYKKLLKPAKLIPSRDIVEDLRIIKTADELKKIEQAQLITQKAFSQILKTLKTGQTELEIAHKLRSIINSLGAQGLAFESIIASGPNSGIPHHITGNSKIKAGDTLLFDFGAKFQNYCADFSRTVFLGKASDLQSNVFNHVLTAQKKALALIKNNIKSHKPHHEAFNHFQKNKLENYFTHGLGHGIGLEVHEAPYLKFSIDNKHLTRGMVFSVEPGLYLNWGGVRIEDLVTIESDSARVIGTELDSIIEIKV